MTLSKVIAVIVLLTFLGNACSSGKEKNIALREGEELARKHCIGCHSFPEPGLLDKKTWIGSVLPEMGKRMNVAIYYNPFESQQQEDTVKSEASLFPTDRWNKIVDWYKSVAPETLTGDSNGLAAIDNMLVDFVAKPISFLKHPTITFIGYDSLSRSVLVGDAVAEKLFALTDKLELREINQVGVGIADLKRSGKFMYALTMGILKPSDNPTGKLSRISPNGKSTLFIDSLRRPIQVCFADLSQDKYDDIIVCEFGYNTGALSWFENQNGSYKKHIIKNLPGAITAQVIDHNLDGMNDVIALMAQANEGIFLFTNLGGGGFSEKLLIQFPPSYGSNFFDMIDFDKDGDMDVVVTNGDNGDFSTILKPYHGIRIFLNNGEKKFEQKYFFPANGVQKVLVRDFDLDGDIDMASISFFPDFSKKVNESFIYWKNEGEGSFKKSSFEEANSGRWMCMDAADIDHDGDEDIVLGNALFSLGEVPKSIQKRWEQNPISLYVLENKTVN